MSKHAIHEGKLIGERWGKIPPTHSFDVFKKMPHRCNDRLSRGYNTVRIRMSHPRINSEIAYGFASIPWGFT